MPDSPVFTAPGIVQWPQATFPAPVEYSIEYSSDALERLRLAALDGLMALPRVGMGIGGLLLGSQVGGRSRILDFLPINCSHADGPSFRLSVEEVEAAREAARALPASSVLGCYCSKTRGKAGGGSGRDMCTRAQSDAGLLESSAGPGVSGWLVS